MDYFDQEWERMKAIEGVYSNDPNDPGGATKFGVTEAEARRDGWTGPMADYPEPRAKALARRRYWEALRLDDLAALSPRIAHELFDSGYNCGIPNAAKWLQEALNLFNRQGRDYLDIEVDGAIGPATVRVLSQYLATRGGQGQLGERVMLGALNCQQGAYYQAIGKSRPSLEDYEFGWFANRVI